MQAMRLGEINFLTEGESQATSAMNDTHLQRPWEMWKRRALRDWD
jgi:HCOMODA/2-hydroxy-3-carboxy-muconic semialdehyde decarboxylase